MRLDELQVEFSPALVSAAVGEVALASDPAPASGVLEVEGGVDTTFVYDIRTEFDGADMAGYRGLRIEAFPAPVFVALERGSPLEAVTDAEVRSTPVGFDVLFDPVDGQTNQPLRVTFRLRVLEHNTPINAWLLGDEGVPPHPVAAGNASEDVGTQVINVYATQSVPVVEALFTTPVVTPNGDGTNDEMAITLLLSQFAAEVAVDMGVFDLAGRRVAKLLSGDRATGAYEVVWVGADDQGELVPPGAYVCQIEVETDSRTFTETRLIGVAY
jgi:hypothetical protein